MKQTILNTKQSTLLENLIVKHGQIVTSEQIYSQAFVITMGERPERIDNIITALPWNSM